MNGANPWVKVNAGLLQKTSRSLQVAQPIEVLALLTNEGRAFDNFFGLEPKPNTETGSTLDEECGKG